MAPADPLRLARQHLETARLLGVDFVPLSRLEAAGDGEADAAPPVANASTPVTEAARGRVAALEELRRRHDGSCPHCTVVTGHTQTVFGEGDAEARVMFVGEAPGEEEDRTGRPFVGRAGRKLDEIITAMGLRRRDVYIANILKARPPNNRTPLAHEVEACAPFLAEQIRIIRPRAIVALGGPSAKFLLQTQDGITRLRGQWASWIDPDGGLEVPVMPTFHPAYLLRNYTPQTRGQVWSDMQAVMARIG